MRPFIIHPGEFIADELQARGWTQSSFADLIGKSKQEVNHLISGRRNLNAERALRIGLAFGTGPEIWINLQNTYDFQTLEQNPLLQASFSQISIKIKEKEATLA